MLDDKIEITDTDIIKIKKAFPCWMNDCHIYIEKHDNIEAVVYEGYYGTEVYVYFNISIPGTHFTNISTKSEKQDDIDKEVAKSLIEDAISQYIERLKKYILKTL